LSTNDLAGYATAQWQPAKLVLLSAGLRWERELLPPPLANLNNPDLPLTSKLPSLGNNWGPRVGLTVGSGESRWPLLRLGYGIYFGRTENSTVETALTRLAQRRSELFHSSSRRLQPAHRHKQCTAVSLRFARRSSKGNQARSRGVRAGLS
jgi:hypothetical protein